MQVRDAARALWVTGPRQASPRATVTQTVPRRLHSMQTEPLAIAGRRPAR